MSKGSGRRPASVTEAEIAANYERIFGKKKRECDCDSCKAEDGVCGWQTYDINTGEVRRDALPWIISNARRTADVSWEPKNDN